MKYVYKIVAALGALATIPLILFSKIFYINMSSLAVQLLAYISQVKGSETIEGILAENGGQMPSSIAESFSIYDIYNLTNSLKGLSDSSDTTSEALNAVLNPVLVFLVICVLIIICAITTALLAIIVKDNRKVMYSSIVGVGLSFMLYCVFEDIADPFLNGTISIATLVDAWWGGLIGNIETFSLTPVFWGIMLVFLGVILWTILYNYTLPEKEKKERKLRLGEADEE